MKIAQHIEIVRSSKEGLSSMSQESADAIFAMLSRHYSHVGITIINDLTDLEALVALRPDLVFLGVKFVPVNPSLGMHDPDKIWVTDYLDDHEMAYTGSGQKAHELELNKPKAKQHVLDNGFNTSPFLEVLQDKPIRQENFNLDYPVFVKPTNRGGGLGIDSDSVAHNFAQLRSKIGALANNFKSDSLVEEYLPGREFSVAILKNEDQATYSVMPIELLAPAGKYGERILSSQVKSTNSEKFLGILDPVIKARVNELAMNVFQAIGATDYGRIDIRLDKFGTPQFLEANLIPSLIEGYGSFPKACLLNIKMDYEAMILHIVRLAFTRTPAMIVSISDKVAIPDDIIVNPLQPLPEAV